MGRSNFPPSIVPCSTSCEVSLSPVRRLTVFSTNRGTGTIEGDGERRERLAFEVAVGSGPIMFGPALTVLGIRGGIGKREKVPKKNKNYSRVAVAPLIPS